MRSGKRMATAADQLDALSLARQPIGSRTQPTEYFGKQPSCPTSELAFGERLSSSSGRRNVRRTLPTLCSPRKTSLNFVSCQHTQTIEIRSYSEHSRREAGAHTGLLEDDGAERASVGLLAGGAAVGVAEAMAEVRRKRTGLGEA